MSRTFVIVKWISFPSLSVAVTGISPMAVTFEMLPLASAKSSLKGRLFTKSPPLGVECDVAPESGVARNDPPTAAEFRAVARADSTALPTAAICAVAEPE